MVPLTEELEEAVLAVGLVVLLFEGSFVELLEAEGTDKVFWVEFLAHSSDAASCDGLLAAGAERAAALVVMHLAVGLPVVLEEAAVDKRGETFPTDKALRVPQGVQGRDVVFQDSPGTASTLGSKHIKVVLAAIGFAILLVKSFRSKESSTLSTEEMFRVPCPVQSRHHFIKDGPVAVVAARREEVVIVLLAVGLPVPLKEVPRADLLLAVGADEVLRVPGFPHGCNYLPSNRLLAGSTDTFGNCSYTQFIQVRLKTSQHGIQLTARLGGGGWRRAAPSFSLCHELEVRERCHQLIQLSCS